MVLRCAGRGEIDPKATLGDWLRMAAEGEEVLANYLKKTALAMGWIDKRALIRNAVILCRRAGLYSEEAARVCAVYENEFSELSSVDIPPFLEYSSPYCAIFKCKCFTNTKPK